MYPAPNETDLSPSAAPPWPLRSLPRFFARARACAAL